MHYKVLPKRSFKCHSGVLNDEKPNVIFFYSLKYFIAFLYNVFDLHRAFCV